MSFQRNEKKTANTFVLLNAFGIVQWSRSIFLFFWREPLGWKEFHYVKLLSMFGHSHLVVVWFNWKKKMWEISIMQKFNSELTAIIKILIIWKMHSRLWSDVTRCENAMKSKCTIVFMQKWIVYIQKGMFIVVTFIAFKEKQH